MENASHDASLTTAEVKALLDLMVDKAFNDPEQVIQHRQLLEAARDKAELRTFLLGLTQAFQDTVQASDSAIRAARQAEAAERTAREQAEAQAQGLQHAHQQMQVAFSALAGAGAPVELMSDHTRSVRELLPEFFKAKEFPRKTRFSYDKAFERFLAVVGDKAVSEVTRNDVARFVIDLEQTVSKKRKNKADIAQTDNTLRPNTSKKYLSHIKEFFSCQSAKNRVRFDPTEGIRVTRKGKTKAAHEERAPFTPVQLQAILDAPIMRGCKSHARITQPGSYLCRDGRFWYGLCKMFTGVRNGELEVLHVTNVVKHCGIWHFDIYQRNKTMAGSRLIPIHSALLKAGFLDWVAERRKHSEDGRLFEPRKYATIWNESILVKAGAKTSENSVYSFRHNFDDGLKELVQDKTRHRLLGHAGSDMGSRYGNGQVTRAQAAAIERLDLGDLDFSFLFVYQTVEEALAAAADLETKPD